MITTKKYKVVNGLLELDGVEVVLTKKERNKLVKEQRAINKKNKEAKRILEDLRKEEKAEKRETKLLRKCSNCKGTGLSRYAKSFTFSSRTCRVCSGTGKISIGGELN